MAERQMAATLDDVRPDHRLRYTLSLAELSKRGRTGHVIDAGCGIGYGSAMLADVVDKVTAIEISEEAHAEYCRHWQRANISFRNCNLLSVTDVEPADAVVCFEFIEHIEFYEAALQQFAAWSDLLIISTPNEEVRPHLQEPVNPYHYRHFRPSELASALEQVGFKIEKWYCQKSGAKPEVCEGTDGKFIIAVAQRQSR